MNQDDNGLDRRLRRAMSGLDAAPGFEARVQARVRELAATPQADLRAQFERRREAMRRRLRRDAWANGITITGVGVAAIALLWRFAPDVERLAAGISVPLDPMTVAVVTLVALGAALWPLLSKTAGLRRKILR